MVLGDNFKSVQTATTKSFLTMERETASQLQSSYYKTTISLLHRTISKKKCSSFLKIVKPVNLENLISFKNSLNKIRI